MKIKRNKLVAGITLVELLVSIFIIMTITAVVVYNHRAFTDNLEITNLAFDIALHIRESQVEGIAVRPGPTEQFQNAFGVYFFIGNGGNSSAFIRFVDLNDGGLGDPDGLYNGGFDYCAGSEECLNQIDIGRGNRISHICWKDNNGDFRCRRPHPTAPSSPPKGVSITFLRPKPDATIKFLNNGGQLCGDEECDDSKREAVVCLESPLGKKKSVHVLPTGQISVQNGEGCVSGGVGGGPSF